MDYVAEYNLAGGSIYNSPFISSVPPGISPTAAQTDPNLHWASSHSNDQSGYYNWYVLTGENNDTYNPNAKKLFDDVFFKLGHPGYGYHLPSRWELTGVFSYSGNTIPLLILLMSTRLLSSVASKKLSPTIISLRVTVFVTLCVSNKVPVILSMILPYPISLLLLIIIWFVLTVTPAWVRLPTMTLLPY